jgi:hypothetical protein
MNRSLGGELLSFLGWSIQKGKKIIEPRKGE